MRPSSTPVGSWVSSPRDISAQFGSCCSRGGDGDNGELADPDALWSSVHLLVEIEGLPAGLGDTQAKTGTFRVIMVGPVRLRRFQIAEAGNREGESIVRGHGTCFEEGNRNSLRCYFRG